MFNPGPKITLTSMVTASSANAVPISSPNVSSQLFATEAAARLIICLKEQIIFERPALARVEAPPPLCQKRVGFGAPCGFH